MIEMSTSGDENSHFIKYDYLTIAASRIATYMVNDVNYKLR